MPTIKSNREKKLIYENMSSIDGLLDKKVRDVIQDHPDAVEVIQRLDNENTPIEISTSETKSLLKALHSAQTLAPDTNKQRAIGGYIEKIAEVLGNESYDGSSFGANH